MYEKLPVETAFYVPKFLAVLHILNDPEAHGFTLPPVDDAVEIEKVTINKQVHLESVANHLGVSYKEIRELNPELRRNCTPDEAYSLNVPKNKGTILLAKISDIPVYHPPIPAYVRHRVKKGESLSVIAQRYGTRVKAIMALNNLRNRNFVRAGWNLKIPVRQRYGARTTGSNSPGPGLKTSGEEARYVVNKGDSLWKIAKRFGTTTKAIQSNNRLTSSRLQIGQVLMIPIGTKFAKNMETVTYTVVKGDSPYTIAQQYRMSLSDFLRINNLTPRSTIFPGQVLLVKAK